MWDPRKYAGSSFKGKPFIFSRNRARVIQGFLKEKPVKIAYTLSTGAELDIWSEKWSPERMPVRLLYQRTVQHV